MAFSRMPGVKLPHRKHTSNNFPARITPPEEVCLVLSMHIGTPAIPVVKPGDTVKVGQLIAKEGGYVSAPVHASVSGTVKRIDDITTAANTLSKAIIIQSDGLMERHEHLAPPKVTDRESFIQAVKNSGVVGLGGAAFPTAVKLNVKEGVTVEEIIINGAECEPYITADTRTFLDRAEELLYGVNLLLKYIQPKKIIIGIENNKKEAIQKAKKLFENEKSVTVQVLPSVYPQGGEKVLIYSTTQKIVPEGKLPLDVGVIVLNVTTVAAIAEFVKTGMPLTEKCITVDGSAVSSPANLIVPIGTRIKDVFAAAGGFKTDPEKIIMGGPMMGHSMPDTEYPVMKGTNALLAFDKKEAEIPEETPCINCGSCIQRCPLHLDPPAFGKAYMLKDPKALEKLKVNLCMECGVCAYVCPAKRHLVQRNRLAKNMLKEHNEKKKKEEAEKNGKA